MAIDTNPTFYDQYRETVRKVGSQVERYNTVTYLESRATPSTQELFRQEKQAISSGLAHDLLKNHAIKTNEGTLQVNLVGILADIPLPSAASRRVRELYYQRPQREFTDVTGYLTNENPEGVLARILIMWENGNSVGGISPDGQVIPMRNYVFGGPHTVMRSLDMARLNQ